jgi:hypothetical protein
MAATSEEEEEAVTGRGTTAEVMGERALSVTCRWHARLDVSWVGSVANSAKVTILCSDPEPLLA